MDLKTLLVIKHIQVYNDDGLKSFSVRVGSTIKGTYDGFLGGYRCLTEAGQVYMAFHYEVVVC